MSRSIWCESRECGRLAVQGERYCDPCLEEIEEQAFAAVRATKAANKASFKAKVAEAVAEVIAEAPPRVHHQSGRQKKGEASPAWVTPEEKLARMEERYYEAVQAENLKDMSSQGAQARAHCLKWGLELPDWAARTLQDDAEDLKAAAFLAGFHGQPYSNVVDIVRRAWSDGAVGMAEGAAKMAQKRRGQRESALRRLGAA